MNRPFEVDNLRRLNGMALDQRNPLSSQETLPPLDKYLALLPPVDTHDSNLPPIQDTATALTGSHGGNMSIKREHGPARCDRHAVKTVSPVSPSSRSLSPKLCGRPSPRGGSLRFCARGVSLCTVSSDRTARRNSCTSLGGPDQKVRKKKSEKKRRFTQSALLLKIQKELRDCPLDASLEGAALLNKTNRDASGGLLYNKIDFLKAILKSIRRLKSLIFTNPDLVEALRLLSNYHHPDLVDFEVSCSEDDDGFTPESSASP